MDVHSGPQKPEAAAGVANLVGYSSAQIKAAERPHLDAGTPLMARAARGLAETVDAHLPRTGGIVLILAGSGNNGGDGLYAAAELSGHGHTVIVLPVLRKVHPAAEAAAKSAGVTFLTGTGTNPTHIPPILSGIKPDVVIDAILGTGSAGRAQLRGIPLAVVEALSLKRTAEPGFTVIAADIPSGLDPDSGEIFGPVLTADVTVTFGAAKTGMLIGSGPQTSGTIKIVPIGIETDLANMTPDYLPTHGRR